MDFNQIRFTLRIQWKRIKNILNLIGEVMILLASLASLFIVIYQFGFDHTDKINLLLKEYRTYVLLTFFAGLTLRYIGRFHQIIHERMFFPDFSIYFILFAVLSAKIFLRSFFDLLFPHFHILSAPLTANILLIVLSIIHLSRQVFLLVQTYIRPSLLFLLSFLFFILIGWGLLLLPNATVDSISPVDALFTAATSVCITGLTTVDVATTFTPVGYFIIMILMQIGGIGVMTFTSFIALTFMRNSSYTSKLMLKDMLSEEKTGGLFRIIVNIMTVTFFIEGIGAWLIYMEIKGTVGGSFGEELFFSVFHSIAAFCCAGISTLSGGYTHPLLVNKYLLHVYISFLIILGGIGFPILFNFLRFLRYFILNRVRLLTGMQKQVIHLPRIISLHTYIVVLSTFILIFVGSILYFTFEYHHTLAHMPLEGKMSGSFLGAVTPRTGGITNVETIALAPATLALTLFLMAIGAGPMSTGGGLKVTTVFVGILAVISFIRDKEHIEVKQREISNETISRALTTFVLYFLIFGILLLTLAYTEQHMPLFKLVFESVSALSTVGLSMNCTPFLSDPGKCILVVIMLVGRIGLLTFFASFWRETKKRHYSYPYENVLM